MKIALINPRGISFGLNPKFKKFWEDSQKASAHKLFPIRFDFWAGFNLGLLIIAALTPSNNELKIIDENFDEIDFNEHFDLVCISTITQQAIRAYNIADKFRKNNCKVILGGIHPTLLPNEAAMHADSVVIGEVEPVWQMILKDLTDYKLKQFYKYDKLFDLKYSPIPRYDLLDIKKYKSIWVQTSRGCPHDCEFCAASKVFGLKYRHKPVDQVIKEIKTLKKIWGNFQINFADDNMFFNRKYVVKLLEKIKPLKIRWAASSDISIGKDEKILKLLKASGCTVLLIGFESINRNTLKGVSKNDWKSRQVDIYPKLIKKIQSYGIGIMGAFIVGFDNDKKEDLEKLTNFIINNKLYASQITVLTPLPGTRLRKKLSLEKRIINNSWDKYTFLDVNFIPKNFKAEELEDGIINIYKKVYSKNARLDVINHFKKIYFNIFKIN